MSPREQASQSSCQPQRSISTRIGPSRPDGVDVSRGPVSETFQGEWVEMTDPDLPAVVIENLWFDLPAEPG